MCWWRSCASGWGWKPVFTRFYRFSVLLFSRKRPFYGHFRTATPNLIYSITLTNSSCSTYSRTLLFGDQCTIRHYRRRRHLCQRLCESVGILASIESVFKFRQITMQMFYRDPVERAYHPTLEQRERRFNRVGVNRYVSRLYPFD